MNTGRQWALLLTALRLRAYTDDNGRYSTRKPCSSTGTSGSGPK